MFIKLVLGFLMVFTTSCCCSGGSDDVDTKTVGVQVQPGDISINISDVPEPTSYPLRPEFIWTPVDVPIKGETVNVDQIVAVFYDAEDEHMLRLSDEGGVPTLWLTRGEERLTALPRQVLQPELGHKVPVSLYILKYKSGKPDVYITTSFILPTAGPPEKVIPPSDGSSV